MSDISLKDVKIALVSLGCDKNLVDSENMLGMIKSEGFILTERMETADVIIVNTCGFIKDAAQESVNAVIDAVEFKKRGKCKAVIMTGCLSERYKDEIFDELEGVDCAAGVNQYADIVNIIKTALDGKKELFTTAEPEKISGEETENFRVLSTPKHYAYLKIAEGCDNRCTYCTIPSIRGGYRSRTVESLVKEADYLAGLGVRELILVAQDTSLYGSDLYGKPMLTELLKKLSLIKKIKWIRILYCYPEHLDNILIDEIASNPKVLHYLDLPVQHAADSVLKRMGRIKSDSQESSSERLETLVNTLRNKISDIVLRTTIITGFPGETVADFNRLLEFINKAQFDRLGVFAYSREEGTPADLLTGHLKESVKLSRKEKIMAIQKVISTKKLKAKIGSELTVVVEGLVEKRNKKYTYYGRSYMDSPDVDGVAYINSDSELKNGQFINILVTGSSEYDLIGEYINELEFGE